MAKRAILLLLLVIIIGCGSAVQNSSSSSNDGTPPTPTEPTFTEDGVTGGTYSSSDSNFTASIPTGTMYSGLSADPEVAEVSLDSDNVLTDSETSVSSAYQLDLQAVDNFITSNTIEVTLAFDATNIPIAKQTAQYIYAKVYDDDSGVSFPVMGTVSGSNLTLNLKGLSKKAIYTLVYNPHMRRVLSSASSSSSVNDFATQSSPWATNRWVTMYDSQEATLRTVVAGILGTTVANLSAEAMDACIKERVSDNAAAGGVIYQAAGFWQPNLEIVSDVNRTGTTEAVFQIHVNDTNNSTAPQGRLDATKALLCLGYGLIYVNSNDVNDTPDLAIGSVKDCVVHEMFHSIQFGYDLGYAASSMGFHEGTATAYGATIDKASTGTPQVRLDDDAHLLSNYIGYHGTKYVFQDFFVYVGRAYNSNSLDYLADTFEQMKTDVDALVAAGTRSARTAPPRATLCRAMNAAFTTKFGTDLPAIYFDYAKQRAIGHSAASQLRTGEPATNTLNDSLFHNVSITRKTVDPEDVLSNPVTETQTVIAPFSSRVFVITPSKAIAEDQSVGLTISSTMGAVGTNIKAALYRTGKAGVELSSGTMNLTKYAKTTDDILTVLVANVGYSGDIPISCRIGPPAENTFEATVTISGTNYPFTPKLIMGSFASITGSINRSSLPAISAYEQTGEDIMAGDMINIATDPLTITASSGTYSFNEDDQVFGESTGQATLTYTNPLIVNVDDGFQVVLESTDGSITFTSYGSSNGDYLSGTFEANVVGSQETSSDPQESNIIGITGTISGRFGATIGTSTEVSSVQ